jgi:putative spermidine/putrescine transport system permease protein
VGLRLFTYLVLAFLVLPMAVIIATSFTELSYVAFPPEGFTLDWYAVALQKRQFLDSFYLSIEIALVTSVLATLCGTLVALAIVRYRFLGREVFNTFFMSPLIIPTIVIGIALLQFYNQIGIGSTAQGLILGHIIITTPYVIRLVMASLTGLDPNIELAARSLGAPPIKAFLKATVPLIRPGILAGSIFAFIMSFENVTVSVFLSTPRMVTLPVRIFNYWDKPIQPWLIAVNAMVILWTFLVIVVADRIISIRGLYGAEERQ